MGMLSILLSFLQDKIKNYPINQNSFVPNVEKSDILLTTFYLFPDGRSLHPLKISGLS